MSDPVPPEHDHPKGLTWSWPDALLGGVYVLPAAVVMGWNLGAGLALAIGVLPASIVGLQPARRQRRMTAVLGSLIGVSMFVGAVIGQVPVLAVVGIVALSVGAAWLASRARIGMVVMTLCVPLVGVGLSYHDDLHKAASAALLMIGGSVYAWLVSLAWPELPPAAPTSAASRAQVTLWYGLRLGAAGAMAAAVGFALDLGHVGWATAAAMLVMRPSKEMQRIRSIGRLVSVALGALLGGLVVRLDPPNVVYAVLVVLALAAAAATRRSRWYVTSAFTTFLVFLLLLYADPSQVEHRFDERVLETGLGVALAYVFGLLLPALWERGSPRRARRIEKHLASLDGRD